MTTIETERLCLTPLSLVDAEELQTAFPHWEVVRWFDASMPWPYPDDGAANFIANVALPAMETGQAWFWSIKLIEADNRLIGGISLKDQADNNRAFWLHPDFQGRGLMTEASDAVTDFWFNDLRRDILRVYKAPENGASRRLSEKRGMRVIDCFSKRLVGGETEVELWEVTQEEWRRARLPNA